MLLLLAKKSLTVYLITNDSTLHDNNSDSEGREWHYCLVSFDSLSCTAGTAGKLQSQLEENWITIKIHHPMLLLSLSLEENLL